MTENTHHRPARIGTIVWGALLVGIAVFSLLAILAAPLSSIALLWSIVGFGALLLISALVAAIVRTVRAKEPDQPIG